MRRFIPVNEEFDLFLFKNSQFSKIFIFGVFATFSHFSKNNTPGILGRLLYIGGGFC